MATNCVCDTLELLKELGMEGAATTVETSQDLLRKTSIAYEHYDHISKEDVDAFNANLRKESEKKNKSGGSTYFKLVFKDLKSYPEVPPHDVLAALKEAKARNCFDTFEIAKIESVVEVPDPILFGKIKDCGDLFVIAQWDNDITVEAIREKIKK